MTSMRFGCIISAETRGCPPGVETHVFKYDIRKDEEGKELIARWKSDGASVHFYQRDLRAEGLQIVTWVAVVRQKTAPESGS